VPKCAIGYASCRPTERRFRLVVRGHAGLLPDGSRRWAAWPPMRRPGLLLVLSGCSGDVGGDDVGVPVEAGPGPVIAHGGARVGVRCGFLNVGERDPASKLGGGDERVPQGAG
jgi:hypothetical protein